MAGVARIGGGSGVVEESAVERMKQNATYFTLDDVKKAKCKYRPSAVKGTSVAELIHDGCPVPLGSVWFIRTGNSLIIVGMFVAEGIRRMGISSKLLAHMIDKYRPAWVTTPAATKLGRLWIDKHGFKWSDERTQYEKRCD